MAKTTHKSPGNRLQISRFSVPNPFRKRKERRLFSDQGPANLIPNKEMTPAVRSVVVELLNELDHLKNELAVSKKKIGELTCVADEDPLLPVLNRRGFLRELERNIAFLKRYQTSAALLYADLDNLKKINDQFGHATGDKALAHTAEILLANVRRSDLVGRLGGDEFAVLLHNVDEKNAITKAQDLNASLTAAKLITEKGAIELSLSIGVALLKPEDTTTEVLSRADQAMYVEKSIKKQIQTSVR